MIYYILKRKKEKLDKWHVYYLDSVEEAIRLHSQVLKAELRKDKIDDFIFLSEEDFLQFCEIKKATNSALHLDDRAVGIVNNIIKPKEIISCDFIKRFGLKTNTDKPYYAKGFYDGEFGKFCDKGDVMGLVRANISFELFDSKTYKLLYCDIDIKPL